MLLQCTCRNVCVRVCGRASNYVNNTHVWHGLRVFCVCSKYMAVFIYETHAAPSTLLGVHSVPDKHQPETDNATTVAVYIPSTFFPCNTHMSYNVVKSAQVINEQRGIPAKWESYAYCPFTPHSWVLWASMCLIAPSCVLITKERRRKLGRLKDRRQNKQPVPVP